LGLHGDLQFTETEKMTIIDAVEAAEDGFKVKNWKQVNSEQGEVK